MEKRKFYLEIWKIFIVFIKSKYLNNSMSEIILCGYHLKNIFLLFMRN